MTSISPRHLLDMLAEVADPRKQKGRRHQGHSILRNYWISRLFSRIRFG